MQTHQANYLEYLETPGTQLSIPVFQRQYSWGVWQCEELWELSLIHISEPTRPY